MIPFYDLFFTFSPICYFLFSIHLLFVAIFSVVKKIEFEKIKNKNHRKIIRKHNNIIFYLILSTILIDIVFLITKNLFMIILVLQIIINIGIIKCQKKHFSFY